VQDANKIKKCQASQSFGCQQPLLGWSLQLLCFNPCQILRLLLFTQKHVTVSQMCRKGQNHIYIWCVYGIFGREITEYTVYGHKRYIYTVLANPTNVGDQENCKALRIDVFNKSQSTPECSKPTKPCKLCTCKLAGLAKPKYLQLNSTVYLGNK